MTDLVNDAYKLLSKIGHGNFGNVWLAKHNISKQLYAIKLLDINCKIKHKQFFKESTILSSIKHPNIITFYGSHIINRNIGIIITEYIDGDILKNIDLQQKSWLQKLDLCFQLLETIQFLHSKNIIHNDLSPKNIILNEKQQLKILDFGSARLITDSPHGCPGYISGTIDWACPQYLINNRTNDFSNDIYSVGCIMYLILTGKRLYDMNSNIQKIIHKKNYMPTSLDIEDWNYPNISIKQHIKNMLAHPKHRLKNLEPIISEIKSIFITHKFISSIK